MTTNRNLTRSERVSAAIQRAVLDLLASKGLPGLTIDQVAELAGVGKAAIYRRYRSKEALVVDVVCELGAAQIPQPDTGSVRADLERFLEETWAVLQAPGARDLVPELIALASREAELENAIRTRLLRARREVAAEIVRRGIARGEIAPGTDIDFILDLLAGGLYWQAFVSDRPLTPEAIARLVDFVVSGSRPVGD